MAVPLDARHIANAAGDFAPQMQNNFMLEIPGLEGDDKDLILLSVQASALPKEATNVVTLPYGNTEAKVAGRTTHEDVPITVRDFVDRETRAALLRWRRTVHDPATGITGLPSAYKKTINLVLVSSDNSVTRVCKFQGAWPSSMDGGTVDHTSDEPVLIEMTLTYDFPDYDL